MHVIIITNQSSKAFHHLIKSEQSPIGARNPKNCQARVLESRISLFVVQPVAFPSNVVVRVHHAADGVEDEEEEVDEPVRQVVVAVALGVGYDEGDEGDDCSGLVARRSWC